MFSVDAAADTAKSCWNYVSNMWGLPLEFERVCLLSFGPCIFIEWEADTGVCDER